MMPVNTMLPYSTRQKKRIKTDKRQDYSFILLRWPLLVRLYRCLLRCILGLGHFFIFVFIMAEFGLYVFIRQLVNTKEWFTACSLIHFFLVRVCHFHFVGRGEKGRP